jgi:hypothetical protein
LLNWTFLFYGTGSAKRKGHNLLSYQLPTIEYLRLRFQLSAQINCTLPAWKGSLLRGAFGHALRRTVCTKKSGQDCRNCLLWSQCAYTRLFETFTKKPPPRFLHDLQASPRPFIFEPHDLNQDFKKGNKLWFDLILLGETIHYLPYVVYAILQMGKSGLGANRYPFLLEQVFCQQLNDKAETVNQVANKKTNPTGSYGWKEVYTGETEKILFTPQPMAIGDTVNNKEKIGSLQLKFLTSTRLVINKTLTDMFDFREIAFKMIRRTLELAFFYMPDQEINWEFHDLLMAADKVIITQRNLTWHDYNRYSNRHQMKMKLGGVIGDIMLDGELTPFCDLLQFAEVLHVGKGATFGLGKIEIEYRKH